MKLSFFLLTAAVLTSGAGSAQVLTPDQAIKTRRIADLRFSPDGTKLAFVVAEPPKGTANVSHIWISDVASGKSRQFTSSSAGERTPRWSPDGRWIAFLSSRDGGSKLFRMPADGGEASALFSGKHNVGNFDWSPDGASIAFTAPEPRAEADEKKVTDKDDATVVDDPARRGRLWILDVASGKANAIGEPGWQVGECVWTRDGARLLVNATPTPSEIEWTESIWEASARGGAWKQFAAPPKPFGRMQLSPDGRSVSVVATRKDGPSPHDLWIAAAEKPVFRNLTAASLDRPVESYTWSSNNELTAVIERGFHTELVRIPLDEGAKPRAVPAGTNPSSLAVHGESIAFAGETAAALPETYLLSANGGVRKMSEIHADWRNPQFAKLELVKYKSFDGLEIEAGLVRPEGGTNLPTVVYIHGGPTGRWRDAFEQWQQLLASRGYAVFAPNIRGSVGYGHKFIESNRNDWGGGDFKDVMAGVDEMVKRGIADPSRLCIGGWSYGGYMSEWAITQTQRFKCAIAGAGLSDLASEFGTENGAAYDRWFFGTPYERLADFQKSSPITFIKNARTPTLILQGEADVTDPIGQSQQLYRGLKAYGVEAQLVLYPREGHGIREEKHRIDLLNRMLAWFDKYLKK